MKVSIKDILPGELCPLQCCVETIAVPVTINDKFMFADKRYIPRTDMSMLSINELIEIEGPLVLKLEQYPWSDHESFPFTVLDGCEHIVMSFRTGMTYIMTGKIII